MASKQKLPSKTQSVIDIPLERFEAAITPSSIDTERKTVDVVLNTGKPMKRYSYRDGEYMLSLSMEPGAVVLDRLNSGAPVLRNHNDWSLAYQTGVVERGWMDNGLPHARIRFAADDDESKKDWTRVENKIYQNVSPGVVIHERKEITTPGEPLRHYLATKWEPYEVSLVPVPADGGAGFLSADSADDNEIRASAPNDTTDTKETLAVEKTNATPEATGQTSPAPNLDEIRLAAAAAERQRVLAINKFAEQHKLSVDFTKPFLDNGASVESFSVAALEQIAKRDAEAGPQRSQSTVAAGVDAADKRREAMTLALDHRAGVSKEELKDEARNYRGSSLVDIARECLEASGTRCRGLMPHQIAEMALSGPGAGVMIGERFASMSGSDFPYLLAASAGKMLRAAYAAEIRTFTAFAAQKSLNDFKTHTAHQLGELPALPVVPPSGEYTNVSFGEGKESYSLATYGHICAFTRQMLINDDLAAFSRIMEMQGRAASRTESDIVWGIITGNPTMGDGNALFSSGHSNLGTGGGNVGVPSVTLLSAGRTRMRLQTDLSGRQTLNLAPTHFIVPAALETYVDQLLTQITPAQASNVTPQWVRSLSPVVEPRLDAADAAAWYLATTQIDGIWYFYLNGQAGPYMESRIGFNIDGVEYKVRLDFGAAAIDWRALDKNEGN